MPAVTSAVCVGDLEDSNPCAVRAADLLAESVPESASGLVPYHASNYPAFLHAALQPPPTMRTVLVRTVSVADNLVAVADWRVLPSELFLNGLSVHRRFRRRGFAQALLTDGIAIARRLNLAMLALDVAEENTAATALYRNNGFADAGIASWYDLTNDCLATSPEPVRLVDWPLFESQRQAYGFGDLTVRGRAGNETTMRVVGTCVRFAGETLPALPIECLSRQVGGERAYMVAADVAPASRRPFVRFRRMRRPSGAGLIGCMSSSAYGTAADEVAHDLGCPPRIMAPDGN